MTPETAQLLAKSNRLLQEAEAMLKIGLHALQPQGHCRETATHQ